MRRGITEPNTAVSRCGGYLAVGIAAIVGCGDAAGPAANRSAHRSAVVAESVRDTLLDGAITVLGRLDDYDEASAFAQVFDRLNQWSHGGRSSADESPWEADALLATLPERLRDATPSAVLVGDAFDAMVDVPFLRDQRWLADICRTARGDAVDDLAIAENLFRWTVRSLAIVTDPPMVPTASMGGSRWFLPGEILLSGRASAAQRSWIFLHLLRHAGLEGVMLATGEVGAEGTRPWIPAVITGGEAYLFEPTYGLPIPGPGGKGVATARQAAADPTILRALSLSDRPYPIQAADMGNLSVLVAADPPMLSRRMRRVEERLAGANAISVSVDASALAARGLAAIPSASGPRSGLWEFPWETAIRRRTPAVQAAVAAELAVMGIALEQSAGDGRIRRGRILRPLYAGRVREFRGDFDGPEGAKAAYLAARPTNAAIAAATAPLAPQQADASKRLYEQMKEDGTYWLGVLTLAEGDVEAAVDYLERMLLKTAPDSRWTDAARVALAEAFEALGKTPEAVRLLESDTSPQRFGSRLRAARLAASGQ